MSEKSPRHFGNPAVTGESQTEAIPSVSGLLRIGSLLTLDRLDDFLHFLLPMIPSAPAAIMSHSVDPSVYTGSAGIAYAFWRLSNKAQRPLRDQVGHLRKAQEWASYACAHVKDRNVRDVPSFLLGAPGIHALNAAIHTRCLSMPEHADHAQGSVVDSQSIIQKSVQSVASMVLAVKDDYSSGISDEVLYGRAGYLYALIFLRRHVDCDAMPCEMLAEVASTITRGRSDSFKDWTWHDTHYLGAAHGTIGILHMLMLESEVFEQFRSFIAEGLAWIHREDVGRFRSSGNYRSSLGREKDTLVQWCHGAPGFIITFCLAYQRFGEPQYLNWADDAARVVWERGLLVKGLGLCHGIAGNAYAFLILYRVTKDPVYLQKCHFMVSCTMDGILQGPYGNSFLRKPDHPVSLFEGLAGMLCLLGDLYNPEQADFPCYDIAC